MTDEREQSTLELSAIVLSAALLAVSSVAALKTLAPGLFAIICADVSITARDIAWATDTFDLRNIHATLEAKNQRLIASMRPRGKLTADPMRNLDVTLRQ
jgi:hypothetical protein